jgi:uncharacterized membrane protein
MLEFIILAYLAGPVVAIPYALDVMSLDPLSIYFYLAAIYIAPLPLIFEACYAGNYYRKVYRGALMRKFSRISRKHVSDLFQMGDEIQKKFEEKLGHLGFYLAISVFTILAGIFWATLFAYFLKVHRLRAIIAIAAGVLVGDAFWLLIALRLSPVTKPYESLLIMFLMAMIFSLIIYGRKRELEVINKVSSAIKKRQ